jgi:hypothetical protein
MTPSLRFWVVLSPFAAAALALAAAGRAADEPKPEVGYTSLFNGKDLTGWHYGAEQLAGKTETVDKRFQVIDGIIVANVGKGIKDLYTTRSYDKDFHLKLEFRAAPRADSGLYIRGKQLQVRDYPTVGPYKNLKHFKNGDWNELDVTVKGTTARCKCNDEVVEEAFKIPAKGEIGLQAEVGKFEFRHIRIKELP